MPPQMTLTATVLDAPDARQLAAFYRRLLGWTARADEPDWVALSPAGGGAGLSFQTEPAYVRPAWPAGQAAAGAVLADYQPQDDVRVYLDPAGHPFCLWIRADTAS
jgi:catechol 2,3-dioxygenase-like lactoylglutathione lyase family enzyme